MMVFFVNLNHNFALNLFATGKIKIASKIMVKSGRPVAT